MKSNKTQAYISAPYRPKVKSMIETMRANMVSLPEQDTKGRQIDVAPWPDHIDADGFVHFQDNGRPEYQVMKHVACKPDIVVYATGYTQVFPFLDESYPTIFDADIRRVWKAGVEDVGFIGFARPSFGMSTLHLMNFRGGGESDYA
jgi:dimethylaniline monooxygenase (N-oxide forming)